MQEILPENGDFVCLVHFLHLKPAASRLRQSR